MKPESVFRKRVIKFLETLNNTVAFPIQQVAIRGTPDFLLCCRGTFVGLELKSEGGTLGPLQAHNLQQIEEKGSGVSIVAAPKNWPSAKAKLRKLDEGFPDEH